MNEFNQSYLPRVEFCRVCDTAFLSSSSFVCPWCSGMDSGDLGETDEFDAGTSCTFCGTEDRYVECEGDCGTAACKMCYKLGVLKECTTSGYPAYYCRMCAPTVKRAITPS